METNQKDLYTTAKQMNIDTPYVCGWHGSMEDGFGWQIVRMKDNAILAMIGSSPSDGQLGVVRAFSQIKAELFDRGIQKTEVTFI